MSHSTYRDLNPPEEETPDEPGGCYVVAAIGIDEYRYWPKLQNAVSDAKGIFDLCGQMEFTRALPLLENEQATGPEIARLIERLRKELEPEDRLLFFFAGHGHTRVEETDEGPIETGYLIPVEARTDQPDDYVKIDGFLQAVSALPARQILVVLDSCRSGFALGRAVKLGPSVEMDASGPDVRLSRRVITSAGKDQAALDSGPVEGHSLFTGILLRGLDWGTADLTGNGQVTTSELGVFLEHRVRKASPSGGQVPDFGAFEGDDRVDMVISLRGGAYYALKVQAFAALQRGELQGDQGFHTLVAKLDDLNPEGAWTRFLDYRRALLDSEVGQALEHVNGLRDREEVLRGMLPVSQGDLVTVEQRLGYFGIILELPEAAVDDFPLNVDLEASSVLQDLLNGGGDALAVRTIGDRQGYELALSTDVERSFARFVVHNHSAEAQHIYFLAIRPDGRLVLGPLLQDPRRAVEGLAPDDWANGTPFEVANVGLTETRLFCLPRPLPPFLIPPTTAARGVSGLDQFDLDGLHRRTVWYRVLPPEDERERLESLRTAW